MPLVSRIFHHVQNGQINGGLFHHFQRFFPVFRQKYLISAVFQIHPDQVCNIEIVLRNEDVSLHNPRLLFHPFYNMG